MLSKLTVAPHPSGVRQILEEGKPAECTVTCKVRSSLNVVLPDASKRRRPAHYLTLTLPNIPYEHVLKAVDRLASTEDGPLNKRTLLVKLPHGGRQFLCKVREHDGYERSPYDLKVDDVVDATLRFGGVWPDNKGYTWNVVTLVMKADTTGCCA